MKKIDKQRLSQLSIFPANPTTQKRLLEFTDSGSDSISVVRFFLGSTAYYWTDIFELAHALVEHYGLGFDEVSFTYPEDFDRTDISFSGVLIYDAWEQVEIPLPDFEELMLRYFQAAQTRAELYHDPILQDPGWPQFLQNLHFLEQRVSQRSKVIRTEP